MPRQKTKLPALAALAALLCLPAAYAGTSAGTDAGLAVGQDHLSGGRDGWRNESLFVDVRDEQRRVAGLRANSTRRFGLDDSQLEAYVGLPVSDRLRAGIDVSGSPTHRVLPRSTLGGNLQYEFARGWLLHGGARQLRYDQVTVNQLSAGAEHYVGDWGAALTVYDSRAYSENTQTVVARLSRYFGDRNRVNLMLANGREPTNVDGLIVNSDVSSASLTGRYWFTDRLAVDVALVRVRQGDFYTRTGTSIGLVFAY